MRIVIVTDTFYPHANGSSSFNQRLAAGLARRGHAVLVIAPSRTSQMEEWDFEGARVFGVRSFVIPGIPGYRYSPPFFIRRALSERIDAFGPDVAHFNSHFSPNTVVLPLLKARGIPLFASNHFIPDNLLPHLRLPGFLLPLMRSLFWWPFRRIYQQFDMVCAPTQTAANLMKPQAHYKKLVVVSNGINTKLFRPENDATALRTRLNLPADRPLLLFVGRLDREKRVDLLLHALARVPQALRCQLVIAGRGARQRALEQLAQQLHLGDRVRMLGYVSNDDLPSLFALSDAFVIASAAELQSIATLEAMASAKPVIAANALALPELVKDGINGYVFAPDDARDLAQTVQKFLTLSPADLKKMGDAGRQIALTHDIERSISAFETYYEELIAAKKSGS